MNSRSTTPGRRPARQSDGDAFRRVWQTVRRNPLLSVGIPALVVVAAIIFVLVVTPMYQASTSIRIDEERSNIALVETLRSLSASGSQVETEMEVLRSRTLAEQVVDSLALQLVSERPRRTNRSELFARIEVERDAYPGEYRLERQDDGRFRVQFEYVPASERGALFPREEVAELGSAGPGETVEGRGVRFALTDAALDHDEIRAVVLSFPKAVKALQASLSVSRPNREANVVVVGYESADSELVRDVPNALATRFIANRQAVHRSEARSTVGFLGEQLDSLTRQIAVAEQELRQFRESEDVVDLETEGSAQLERLAEMQATRDMLETERVSLARLLADIEAGGPPAAGEPSPYRRLLAFPSLLKNAATSELLGILAELDNDRAELLERRTPQDPPVVALSERIRDLERQLHSIATTYLAGVSDQSAEVKAVLDASRAELGRIPAKAITLARLTREGDVLGEIYQLVQVRLKEAEIAAAIEDMSARVVDPAVLPIRPFKPNKVLSLGLALIFGLGLGIGGALLREHMDTRLHTREDLQATTDLTVLGLIPRMHAPGVPRGPRWRRSAAAPSANGRAAAPRLITALDPHDPVAEAYRSLRTNITFAVPEGAPRTLVFTSPTPGDGKSTTATNLAVTLALQDQRVLLVDADLRRGDLSTVFDSPREPGLSNLLLGRASPEDAIRSVPLTDGHNLDLLPTGTLPPNPAELLGSARMRRLLEELLERYETILLDAPPLNSVTDAAVLGTNADAVLLVARAGVTDRIGLAYALEQLDQVRAPVLGTVLNDVDHRHRSYYGSGAGYGYQTAGGRARG